MVSYADFHRLPACRRRAMAQGLHAYLGLPEHTKVYLDNGAFYFLGSDAGPSKEGYEEFVFQARPDWWSIPQDFIPTPKMTAEEQKRCFMRTMEMNLAYQHDGYVPVIHISRFLGEYTAAVRAQKGLSLKPSIALGGIVPNLLRTPKALPYIEILDSLTYVRQTFANKQMHVFGVGGTATLHLAVLLGMNSVDSSGWRNRAARGIVQLPGSGDRAVANLGSWHGRKTKREGMERFGSLPVPDLQTVRDRRFKGRCR
jgi:hypothetical protein